MHDRETRIKEQYEPPVVRVLGPLHTLTLQNKDYGPTDGFLFQGTPIGNASP